MPAFRYELMKGDELVHTTYSSRWADSYAKMIGATIVTVPLFPISSSN